MCCALPRLHVSCVVKKRGPFCVPSQISRPVPSNYSLAKVCYLSIMCGLTNTSLKTRHYMANSFPCQFCSRAVVVVFYLQHYFIQSVTECVQSGTSYPTAWGMYIHYLHPEQSRSKRKSSAHLSSWQQPKSGSNVNHPRIFMATKFLTSWQIEYQARQNRAQRNGQG